MTDESEPVHFLADDARLTSCGVNIELTPYSRYSPEWNDEITCGACRLERPMNLTGRPERHLAPAVVDRIERQKLEDALLAARAEVLRLETALRVGRGRVADSEPAELLSARLSKPGPY